MKVLKIKASGWNIYMTSYGSITMVSRYMMLNRYMAAPKMRELFRLYEDGRAVDVHEGRMHVRIAGGTFSVSMPDLEFAVPIESEEVVNLEESPF